MVIVDEELLSFFLSQQRACQTKPQKKKGDTKTNRTEESKERFPSPPPPPPWMQRRQLVVRLKVRTLLAFTTFRYFSTVSRESGETLERWKEERESQRCELMTDKCLPLSACVMRERIIAVVKTPPSLRPPFKHLFLRPSNPPSITK